MVNRPAIKYEQKRNSNSPGRLKNPCAVVEGNRKKRRHDKEATKAWLVARKSIAMIIHREYQQGSLDWLRARAGIPTASEFGNLITPKCEIRAWSTEMPKTYLAAKLAEAWTGMPLSGINSFAMEQGSILQDEAIPWLSLELNQEIESVGFITDDAGRVGCSPDGLIGEIQGVEVKCPEPTAHVKYLLGGKVPDDYLAQVHGSMFVTGLASWRFVSYRRGFPNLVLIVERDGEIQEKIGDALQEFLDRFEIGMQRLIDLNGGDRPKRPTFPKPEPSKAPGENADVPIP